MLCVRGLVVLGLAVFTLSALFAAVGSLGTAAQDDKITVLFDFSPAKSAYAPGENFSVNITVGIPASSSSTGFIHLRMLSLAYSLR